MDKNGLLGRMFKARASYLFIAPSVLILGLFIFLPVVLTFVMSTQFLPSIDRGIFVGLDNYAALLHDASFWSSLLITGQYVLMTVPFMVCGSLFFAVLLNIRTPFQAFFKGLYYLPVICSGIMVGVVWKWIYHGEIGVMNYFLGLLGMEPRIWLGDPALALPSLALVGIWKNVGYYMIIFLAGLQTVPEELYEAARIDGARKVPIFFRITLPLLKPIVVTVLILATIAAFQAFDMIYVMTFGGPMESTSTILWKIYVTSFVKSQPGEGAAMGVVLFVIILGLSLVQFFYFKEESLG